MYHIHYSVIGSKLVLLPQQSIPEDVWKDEKEKVIKKLQVACSPFPVVDCILHLLQIQQAPHGNCYAAPMLSHAETRTLLLDEENAMLRKKVEELKKQVSDLTATNEFLLDQNAQLRMGGKRTANVTAVTVPAVTITNTGAPTMQVQPITAQIQPAQAPTPQQMVRNLPRS